MDSVSVLCVKKRALGCVQNTTNKNCCNDLINQKEKLWIGHSVTHEYNDKLPFDGNGDRKQSDKPMHRLCIVWSRVKRYVENVVWDFTLQPTRHRQIG